MSTLSIFIVEDEEILRVTLTDELVEHGYHVQAFDNAHEALAAMKNHCVDVVVSDIKMPQITGMELLAQLKKQTPETQVILMTAYGSVNSAVEAMKNGAYDYLTKPFDTDELHVLLKRIEELKSIKTENIQLRSRLKKEFNLSSFVGNTPMVQNTLEQVRNVAESDTTVLITGETGTGKELLANIIHNESQRHLKPMIKVSCAVLSREIFESELFGHEKGAFTGAAKTRVGRFEAAQGGTILLDDVDDIPLDLQVKLLRVLQEKEFERVGSNKSISCDVRVIAATKADLHELVKQGKFRDDLYYRLNIFPIHIPALRERSEDVPLLIQHFLNQLAPELNLTMDETSIACMQNYYWAGNVRELRNIVERLILSSNKQSINASHLPMEIQHPDVAAPELCLGRKPLDLIMNDVEASLIRQALQQTHGHQARAAELLGIPASTLRTKIGKYNFSRHHK